jgi:hypothetical protein
MKNLLLFFNVIILTSVAFASENPSAKCDLYVTDDAPAQDNKNQLSKTTALVENMDWLLKKSIYFYNTSGKTPVPLISLGILDGRELAVACIAPSDTQEIACIMEYVESGILTTTQFYGYVNAGITFKINKRSNIAYSLICISGD